MIIIVIIKIIKTLIIKTIRIIKIIQTINDVNKIKIDFQTLLFCQYRRASFKLRTIKLLFRQTN